MTQDEIDALERLHRATYKPHHRWHWKGHVDGDEDGPNEIDSENGANVASGVYKANADFIVHVRNNIDRIIVVMRYALQLEGMMHDAAQGNVPASLLADARRLGREEMLEAVANQVTLSDYDRGGIDMRLPPLIEPPTNKELRERCERYREALGYITDGSNKGHPIDVAREALK